MYSIRQFSAFYSHFQVTSGEMTSLPGHFRLPEVRDISCHVTAYCCELQLVGSERYSACHFSAFHSHFQVTSVQMTSLPGHLRLPEVT